MTKASVKNWNLEVFLVSFPRSDVIIMIYCVREIFFAKAKQIACIRTIDPSHISIKGERMALRPKALATSVRNASKKYVTEAVVWSHVKYVATGRGEDVFRGFLTTSS